VYGLRIGEKLTNELIEKHSIRAVETLLEIQQEPEGFAFGTFPSRLIDSSAVDVQGDIVNEATLI
jgi:hypothetical protein